MALRSSPRARPSLWARPDVLCAVGLGGLLGWFLLRQKAPREFSLVEGKTYEFTLVAHPYGNFPDWWAEAEEALTESGVSNLVMQLQEGAPGTVGNQDVLVRFTKPSPVTATLLPHTVLYPNTPSLATATLLRAEIAKGYPLPLGTSTTVSGDPKSKHPKNPGIDRAARYLKMAEDCEADARDPRHSSQQELLLVLAKEYRARAARHRSGRHS